MGTRGLLGLIIQGKRHAAYNHWDSYPEGLGQQIVDFILGLTPEEWDAMALRVKEIEWVDDTTTASVEIQEHYTQLGYLDLQVSKQTKDDWYCLLRNVQGAPALTEIQKGNLKHLFENVKFLEDTLFCEWAYFIDFENRTMETWKEAILLHQTTFDDLVKSKSKSSTYYMKSVETLYQDTVNDERISEEDEDND